MRSTVAMRVGALARRTGVSVRTLHHYDEIGLLVPSRRTEAGHRLYGSDEIVRLQQILSLRQLGFSLQEIQAFLNDPACSPQRVVEMHLARLRSEIEYRHQLCRRLEALAAHLQTTEEVSVETFLQTMEAMTMYEKYYTPEQLQALGERAQRMGEDEMRKVEKEWEDLYAQVRAEMERGTDPTSEPVLRLARRALELIQAFTGGDAGIERSLNTMYHQEGPVAASRGMVDQATWDYFGRAMAAARKAS